MAPSARLFIALTVALSISRSSVHASARGRQFRGLARAGDPRSVRGGASDIPVENRPDEDTVTIPSGSRAALPVYPNQTQASGATTTTTTAAETPKQQPPLPDKPSVPFLKRPSAHSALLSSVNTLKHQFERIRSTSVRPIAFKETLHQVEQHSTQIFSALIPAVVAVFSHRKEGLSFWSVYALALLGSSCGFYLFLYFISVGYALGIALPAAMALWQYRDRPAASLLHTGLVVAWGLRLSAFYVWREYVNWPALHRKIVQVNETKAPAMGVKLLCWALYSFMYVCMLAPCWFRLDHNPTGRNWALGLQLAGLALETVADWQKSVYKATPGQRYEWCHAGVWKYSTHPNYAGEWLFWLGTFVGGHANGWVEALFLLSGFSFVTVVLRGAVESLDRKHWEKYGSNPAFADFVGRYGVFGPKFWKRRAIDAVVADEEEEA